MEPELLTGDNLIVNKTIHGARIFNLFATLREDQVTIYRMPGVRNIQRDEVLVFNFPYPASWSKMEMHIMKYYVKRCIGLPGDTLQIQNGRYRIKGVDGYIGNLAAQKRIANRKSESFEAGVYNCFPYDSLMAWTIKNFGPLYIPKAGDLIEMNCTNFALYRKLITWEQQDSLIKKDGIIYLHGAPLTKYRFRKNYYFMAGDHGEDSQDSRYWGLLPEEYIVGKAWLVWKSVDPYTEAFRWNRFLKVIH